MKIRPVGAEFLHADRRTDMTKVIVTFRNFSKAPNNNNNNKHPSAEGQQHRVKNKLKEDL